MAMSILGLKEISLCRFRLKQNPNTEFIDLKNELKNICKKLKDITISSSYEFGEGEKKILEHIIHNKKSGSYVIFSPDADTILLSLIMQNKLLKLSSFHSY